VHTRSKQAGFLKSRRSRSRHSARARKPQQLKSRPSKTERLLYNQQHHEAPIEPPVAPAMAGINLRQRLKAARRRGEIGDGTLEGRITNALVELKMGLWTGSMRIFPPFGTSKRAFASPGLANPSGLTDVTLILLEFF
jgi:hypothetical protein